MGPEHEFSVVNENLNVLPIVDKVIKDYCGRTVNFVEQPDFVFGKELQLHVLEVKANEPFLSPKFFEETMQNAVTTLLDFLEKKYHAHLLGTGMHPLLKRYLRLGTVTMKVIFTTNKMCDSDADMLILPVRKGMGNPAFQEMDGATKGALTSCAKQEKFDGQPDRTLICQGTVFGRLSRL